MLSVREAADRLGVSYSALKQWIYKGTVRTVRTGGGHHRVPLAEVDRLLGQQAGRGRARRRDRPAAAVRACWSRSADATSCAASSTRCAHDGLLAQVRLRIGDQRLTAVITRDALAELKLTRGDEAVAIIKSTEVMVGREQPREIPRPRRPGTTRRRPDA